MFLKELQIKGFKSFADSTTLVLEPGVTVVVGPNGSGKSNIVDAIGWVLGAQAPSAVRSQKMDDVIFAGTQRRAALGRAEVSLTIDNSAGLLPIEFSEVRITRVLFRNGDSEYSINGAPCRLLDLTDLLSDTGVGRQQHVIISQGQIDAVLNSKPEDRRAIIEEAAGILKFRKRKERSERRLVSTEANLTRLSDLLREVRRQLKPLERQADAARRHGAVVAELQDLRVYLAGRQLSRLRTTMADAARADAERATEHAELRARQGSLDAQIVHAESQISALGEEDHSDHLTRYERLRERARGLSALLSERRRSIERERDSGIDEGVIPALESEHAQLVIDLDAVGSEASGLLEKESEWRAADAALGDARAAFAERWGDGVIPSSGELSAVRAKIRAAQVASERTTADRARVSQQVAGLSGRTEQTRAQLASAKTELALIVGDEPAADAAGEPVGDELVEAAEAALAVAEAELTEADETARDAAAARSRWAARAEALTQALNAARRAAGADRLAGIDGVLGTVLDLVAIDDGWGAAVEAGIGESLRAVVVSDVKVATDALDRLQAGDVSAAILVLGAVADVAATGDRAEGTEPVRTHVHAERPEVARLLDRLLADVVAVDGGWREAVDIAVAHPELVVVTRGGDRFAATGWTIGSGAADATGAALEEATAEAETAEAADAAARTAAREALDKVRAARDSVERARRERADRRQKIQSLTDRIEHQTRTLEGLDAESVTLAAHADELAGRATAEQDEVEGLLATVPALEAEEAARSERAAQMARERGRVDELERAANALRSDLEVRAAGVEERRRMLTQRQETVSMRLQRSKAEAEAAAERRIELEARSEATERLAAFLERRLVVIERDLADVRERRRHQSESARAVISQLDSLRAERVSIDRLLDAHREAQHKAEVTATETKLRLEALVEHCRAELDVEPSAAEQAPLPEVPEGVSPLERVRQLERELKQMGPINPLALTEFAELSERLTFLEGQLDDVRQTRRELNKVIRAVDDEIMRVFSSAFADVVTNFEFLFDTLFPGGRGKLSLTTPEDLLDTGVEIEAKPSGKNVKKLSLLSGGERSLVALAFLFAVFRSRPSPFYVMDEVEAALDDVNLQRFLGLIAEFRSTAQLIVVSHQKRTMEAADVLYGVTMEPGGSSKVLSERVRTDLAE